MITCISINSVEFYVVAATVAAAVIALCSRPSSRGEARTHLLSGTLCDCEDANPNVQALDITCHEDRSVALTRRGLDGMTTSGAVSLAVTVIGFDITIEERIVTDLRPGQPINTALFTIDFLASERYHIRYNSETTSGFIAFTLHNRPGMRVTKLLIK